MKWCLKIIAVFVLSVFFGRAAMDTAVLEDTISETILSPYTQSDSGHICTAGDGGGCYIDWNTLSLSEAENVTVPVQWPGTGVNVRCRTGRQPHSHLKSYLTGGKTVSIVSSMRFHSSAELYPSGNHSFSHHLASLKKLRC